jgi:hypothetical protein
MKSGKVTGEGRVMEEIGEIRGWMENVKCKIGHRA